MLYLVLILVLAALGLLVAALVTSNSVFAWVSIVLSLLAAAALFADWLLRRRAERAAEAKEAADAEEAEELEAAELVDGAAATEPDETEVAEADAAEPAEADAVASADADQPATDEQAAVDEQTAVDEELVDGAAAADEPAEEPEPEPEPAAAVADPADDEVPGEEETDAADLLIVCELDDQVIVVDEHPRYHLPECGWLVDRDTIPIAVSEARELGFTPCARCGPDAKLAGRARRQRRKASR